MRPARLAQTEGALSDRRLHTTDRRFLPGIRQRSGRWLLVSSSSRAERRAQHFRIHEPGATSLGLGARGRTSAFGRRPRSSSVDAVTGGATNQKPRRRPVELSQTLGSGRRRSSDPVRADECVRGEAVADAGEAGEVLRRQRDRARRASDNTKAIAGAFILLATGSRARPSSGRSARGRADAYARCRSSQSCASIVRHPHMRASTPWQIASRSRYSSSMRGRTRDYWRACAFISLCSGAKG
jgi:hypothetical protein